MKRKMKNCIVVRKLFTLKNKILDQKNCYRRSISSFEYFPALQTWMRGQKMCTQPPPTAKTIPTASPDVPNPTTGNDLSCYPSSKTYTTPTFPQPTVTAKPLPSTTALPRQSLPSALTPTKIPAPYWTLIPTPRALSLTNYPL